MTLQTPTARALTGPFLPFTLTAALVLAAALGAEALRLALRYERSAIAAGEWWRLATGQFVHLGWSHTLLNLAGLGLAAVLFGRKFTARRWIAIGAASGCAIAAALFILRPDLAWYVGLSGILHGLFAAGALSWCRAGEREGYVLAGFLVVKLAWEQFAGALPFSVATAGGPVVVDAHLAGALGGFGAAAWLLVRDWRRGRR